MRRFQHTRAQLIGVADRIGAAPHLRGVHHLMSRSARRDRRDNEHLRLLLAFTLERGSNCIDVGAYKGAVLADIVRLAPDGRHIAYEPLPHLAAELVRRFPGVDVRNAAVGKSTGTVVFTHVVDEPALSGLHDRWQADEEVEHLAVAVESLDDALPAGYVPAFMKIDVEGAEFGVLEGAKKTIREHRPIIAFEHGAGGADYFGTTPGDIHALLVDECGLRIFDIDGEGPYDRASFESAFTQPIWNFVARA